MFMFRFLLFVLAVAVLAGCESPNNPDQTTVSQEGDLELKQDVIQHSEGDKADGKVLRHAVFFKFKDGTSAGDLKTVTDAFAILKEKIPAIVEFQWGGKQ